MKKDNLYNEMYFWTELYPNTNYVDWAASKAYLDMCRTFRFKNKDDKLHNKIKQSVINSVINDSKLSNMQIQSSWSKEEYDDWHSKVCNNICSKYNTGVVLSKEMSIGQAQKWMNMTIKYLWLAERCGLIDDKNIVKFIRLNENHFHIPLDSNIIKYVNEKSKNKKMPVNGLNDYNGGEEDEIVIRDKGLMGEGHWSSIKSYDDYLAYQERIRKRLDKKKYHSALEWELEHWKKAIDFYNKKQ